MFGKIIKEKSVAFYIQDEFGGLTAVSKNAVTRLNNKIEKGLKPGESYSVPGRLTEKIKSKSRYPKIEENSCG